MAVPTHSAGCAWCGKLIIQKTGGGRRRDYCDVGCRRRSQRKRDRERRTARVLRTPQYAIALELAARAEELAAAHGSIPLSAVLDLAGRVGEDAVCLAAVAVDDARLSGADWAEVAAAASVSEASARARWGGMRVVRLLAAREAAATSPVQQPTSRAWMSHHGLALLPVMPQIHEAGRALGRAMTALHRRSGAGLEDVAGRIDLPYAAVCLLLEGQAVAPWAVTYMLARELGGWPADVRLLWERAWGASAPVDGSTAPRLLAAALRGARLAAGEPDLAALCTPALDTRAVTAVFGGGEVPGWNVLSELVVRLGADPAGFRALWRACQDDTPAMRKEAAHT